MGERAAAPPETLRHMLSAVDDVPLLEWELSGEHRGYNL